MRIIGAINHYLLPAMLVASIIWGICLLISICRHRKGSIKIWMIRYVFITYLISVLLVTDAYKVFVESLPAYFMEPNLIPFVRTVIDIYINPVEMLTLIGCNMILFVPFGFLLVPSFSAHEWKVREILGVTVMVVLIVEVLEYFSGRYMDIDDVFINTIGSILGYYIYKLIERVWKFIRYRKRRTAGLFVGLCVLAIAFSGCGEKEVSIPELQEFSRYNSWEEKEIRYDFVGEKEIFIADENLKTPKAMVCVGDSLYVVNKDGHSVLEYSKEGFLQNTIKGFWNPVAIAHYEKEIYVANENDGKVQVMDEQGDFLRDYYVEALNQINLSVLDIEADEDNIYLTVVADNKESLSVYQVRKEDGQVSKIGESCMGVLCRDSENRVYYAQTYEFVEGDGYTGFESGESSLLSKKKNEKTSVKVCRSYKKNVVHTFALVFFEIK